MRIAIDIILLNVKEEGRINIFYSVLLALGPVLNNAMPSLFQRQ